MILKDEILQPDILSLMRNLRNSDIFNKNKIFVNVFIIH